METLNNQHESVNLDSLFEEMDFDVNEAFQIAASNVLSDGELELNEKIGRMETIITEADSDFYREMVDFQALAAQMQMFCNHDHSLAQSMMNNETIFGFMENAHNHNDHGAHTAHDHDHKDDSEKDDKEKKKKNNKKRLGWFAYKNS